MDAVLRSACVAAKPKPASSVDALCLAQACRGVMTDLWCVCKQWARHYDVPEDVVFAMVADQFIFARTGIPSLEGEYFAQMANDMPTEELIAFYGETKARYWQTSLPFLSESHGRQINPWTWNDQRKRKARRK